MPRVARIESESGYYHVTARGTGKRLLFEDDADREFFVGLLERLSSRHSTKVISWALMSNHYHLLCEAELADLKRFMSSLNTSYSQHFNGTHGHVGHVFQGRYSSFAINNTAHLIDVIRYIHLNPLDAGVHDLEHYPWTSYPQYLGAPGICDLGDIEDILANVDDIRKLHDAKVADQLIDLSGHRERLSDAEAFDLARTRFGNEVADRITTMQKADRDRMIGRLYGIGLSEPQIVRLTGLGRSIVHRARKAM